MGSFYADPHYVALARRAAGRLGTTDQRIINAILAQWQCEHGTGDLYPPTRNNPGNLARGAVPPGFPYTVQYPNPQLGNPIVTFYTPESGADAYATLLKTGSRYAAVRTAVAMGDGVGFIKAVGASGYGTGTTCMLGVYKTEPLPTPTHPVTYRLNGGQVAYLASHGAGLTAHQLHLLHIGQGVTLTLHQLHLLHVYGGG
jgi:hypothetical protein